MARCAAAKHRCGNLCRFEQNDLRGLNLLIVDRPLKLEVV
jgi:hypothetical protein